MKKVIFLALIIVTFIVGVSILWNHGKSSAHIKSQPLTQNDQLFNQLKDKIKGEPSSWGKNDGSQDSYVQSGKYIVIDESGNVLSQFNADEKHSPASLTKIVTAMVVLDLVSPADIYTVPKEAEGLDPTILKAKLGEKFTVDELLHAMLMMSANDAAKILSFDTAQKLGGDESVFINLMNEKVKKLGLQNTHFVNSMGYDDPNQYSTPRDLAYITHFALTNYPLISQIVATKEATLQENGNHRYYEIPNWNSLLDVYPGVTGVKIGHTDDAGHNTIVTSNRENKTLTTVMLGAPDRRARDFWTADLLNNAFSTFGIKPFKVQLYMLQRRSEDWSLQISRQKQMTQSDILQDEE